MRKQDRGSCFIEVQTLGLFPLSAPPTPVLGSERAPLLHFAHLANSPEIHPPKPRFPSTCGCHPLDIGGLNKRREEWVEAGGKKGCGDRGNEGGRPFRRRRP